MEELFDIFTLAERPRTMVDNQEGEEDGADDAVVEDVRDEEDERFMTKDSRKRKRKEKKRLTLLENCSNFHNKLHENLF